MFTTWLHNAEFREPDDIGEQPEYEYMSDKRFWEEFLGNIIRGAEFCCNEEELNEELDWALKGETNADR